MYIGKMHVNNTENGEMPTTFTYPSFHTPILASQSDAQLLAVHGKTFHFAARFLPFAIRQKVITLYAFFRTLDNLVDEPEEGLSSSTIKGELEAWREWFLTGYAGVAPRPDLGARLAGVLAETPMPMSIFLDFLEGLLADLEPCALQTFDELRHYCHCVAGTVGLAMTYVLGVSSPTALEAAENLGIAMQLTNILRDVGSDCAMGRFYLPEQDLRQSGISHAHLKRLYTQNLGPDEGFNQAMQFQIARAYDYYMLGLAGIWLLPMSCRLPILIAGRLYRRILAVITRRHYDVLRRRASTNAAEKLQEALIAFMLHRLWCNGENQMYGKRGF